MCKVLNKYLFFTMLVLSSVTMYAQPSLPNPDYAMPKITPPSPTAAAFARYGEIPVDISTGVPSIEIPVYTVTSRKLSVPLSLSYHASGIKVNDISTPVGLGWVLSGMGIVSRTVLDLPDELSGSSNYCGGKATYSSKQVFTDALALAQNRADQITMGTAINNDLMFRDKKSDRFNYSLPAGGSGAFRYDFNSGNCIQTPYKPIIITNYKNNYSSSTPIQAFSITDENGVKYSFAKAMVSSTQSSTNPNCNGYAVNPTTSWYITGIETADGSDQIQYLYRTEENTFTLGYYSHSVRHLQAKPEYFLGICGLFGDNNFVENNQAVNFITTYEPLLDKIITATTIVEFVYAADRTDWSTAPYRLSSIKVYDKLNNQLVKEIVLNNNAYFDAQRLKLSGVTIKGNNGTTDQNYSFNYDPGFTALPAYNKMGVTPTFSEDYWGYYNGSINGGLIPTELIPSPGMSASQGWGSSYGGSRRPDHNFARAYLLNQITYPTGGTTSFEFEPNYGRLVYPASNNPYGYVDGNVGGFRVKRIVNNDWVNNTTEKNYIYGTGTVKSINWDQFSYIQKYLYYYPTVDCGNGYNGLSNQSLIVNSYLTQSSSFSPVSLSNGAPVVYTNVTEIIGSPTANTGKNEYLFSGPDEPQPETWNRFFTNDWRDNGRYQPLLVYKKTFKNDNGVYKPVSETDNSYSLFRNNEFSTGVNVVKTFTETVSGSPVSAPYNLDFIQAPATSITDGNGNIYPGYVKSFEYTDEKASEKTYQLTQSVEKHYNPDGASYLAATTNYTYGNSNHLFPTEKTVTGSDGQTMKTTYQYAPDNTTDGFAWYMQQANMVSPVIEMKNFAGTSFLNSVKTNYTIVPGTNGMIVPDFVQTKKGNNNAEIRLHYNSYDAYGNITDVSKEGDIHEAYIYGYNSTLPVVKIVSPYGSMATTAAQYLNQPILNNPANDAALRSHLNTLRTVLPADALIYTYTYKPLTGVTSETDANGKTIYYEYDFANRLTLIRDKDNNIIKKICYNYAGQVENCSGLFYNDLQSINLARNNCGTGYSGTNVTYTVPPGRYNSTISAADANAKAVNDINTNAQAYANQNGLCIGIYSNTYQSQTFTRNNCGSGYFGTGITYGVPAGSYHSPISVADANQMALADIASNGQNYANQNGQCIVTGLPYAKLQYENVASYYDPGTGCYNYYADIVVRFYQDYSCTIPVNFAGSFNIQKQEYSCATNQYTYTYPSFNVNANAIVLYPGILTTGCETAGQCTERYLYLQANAGYTIVY
ncbi:DUF5977 domain-containing protein [Ferruginibacter sp.]